MTDNPAHLMTDSIGVMPDDHLTLAELTLGLDQVRGSPADAGTVELIACRPAVDERFELEAAELDVTRGLVLDSWSTRGTAPNPKAQVTVMNARAAHLFARDRSRWALAGDQIYVDFDLSQANIPPGTRLALGSAVLEVSDQPHLGCLKFTSRFGAAAREFVNSPEGTALNLRGINTRVVQGGTVNRGDAVRKVSAK